MWTNKQIWEFEQLNEDLRFDLLYIKSKDEIKNPSWDSKMSYPDSPIRDTVVKKFEHLAEGCKLLIANKGKKRIEDQFIPYLMAVMADIMIDEEICLNYKITDGCLAVSIDTNTDVIDCKEFFEEFYHLATEFNYDTDTRIPNDETEAELYLTRLQEEFDEKRKLKLGENYLPGNNDPDSLNSE